MSKNDTWIAKASDMPEFSFFLFVEYEDTKFVSEWELLRNAFNHFYSYSTAYDMGARIMDLTCAINRFTRLYEKNLPNICERLKKNYLYMDNKSLNMLIDENEMEVRGALKREEKDQKKSEIQSVRHKFEV
jgi:hypothetical protein